MAKKWVGCASTNFRAGRPPGFAPTAVVMHRTGGALEAHRRRFADPSSSMSAHYGVALDGSIEQYVSETDTAFHAGVVVNPSWTGLVPRVNPNFYTIGIEHESGPEAWPDAQQRASAALLAEIADRWGIPLTPDRIVPHSAIRCSVQCPGAGAPIAAILDLARARPVRPAMPTSVFLKTLVNTNLRSAPRRTAQIRSVIPAGTELIASGFTDAGERIDGNPFWYSDATGNYLWAGATNVPTPSAVEDEEGPGTPAIPSISTDEMDLAGTDQLRIDRSTHVLAPSQYYPQPLSKDLIVLHFTAGTTAQSAVSTWRTTPEHVATAYVVDLDATVYEVFPPECWAYHLGIRGGTPLERRSIGIEIANVGPLQPSQADSNVLNWWPREWGQKYCTREQADRYVEANYRQKRFFATYPVAQLDAVGRLVRYLCERFGIPRRLPASAARLECDLAAFAGYKGIATHVNFRPDKWDVGPAFDWERLGL
jgi:N-acetyl-anhydromuramyl-L-alanine amidase AmpD